MAISATNITDARNNLKKITDDVAEYDDQVIITKPKNKNVVVMSESEFNSWQETLYLFSSETNQVALQKSFKQAETGQVKALTPEEWNRLSHE